VLELAILHPPLATQQTIVAEIEAEQALVAANRELIERFEKKIQATLGRVWGEDVQGNRQLDSQQKREILLFYAVAATTAIMSIESEFPGFDGLLEEFHRALIERIGGTPDERAGFEKLLRERLIAYLGILDSGKQNVELLLGKQFADYLLYRHPDYSALELVMVSAKTYHLMSSNLKDTFRRAIAEGQ
jgi:hypothetical protein